MIHGGNLKSVARTRQQNQSISYFNLRQIGPEIEFKEIVVEV